MKFLHVITTMDPRSGGPCQGIRNLAPSMFKAGNSVEVVCLDDPGSEYLAGETVRIHALGKSRGPWAYHPALRPWLESNLSRFDVIILNGLWHYAGYALSRVAQRPSMPPYFIFPHGMLDPWFQQTAERRLKALRNRVYWRLVEQHVVHKARGLLFTCTEEMRLARDTFRPYQPKQQINVSYGVSRPPPYDAKMGKAFAQACPNLERTPYLLFLGRIHHKKGVELLINAYAVFCREAGAAGQAIVPNLVIAGPGLDTAHGQEMQALAARSCPPNSVFWPEMITGHAKWGAIYHCEAMVLFSHQENFGIAIVEAMACEKPVLISNQINIWREIEEDGAGLAGPDTPEGSEDILRRWAGLSPEEKLAMKSAAKSAYENRF
ncbi:MAG TPA: glycosyltransferase, partial [Verrucomicrobiae bacterium]|nr:glycosyltransferase [Verrucomicrobiae bacterium]